jgi:hypothetical protein
MTLLLAMGVPLLIGNNTSGAGDGIVGLYNMVMLKYTTLVARMFSTHQRIFYFTLKEM